MSYQAAVWRSNCEIRASSQSSRRPDHNHPCFEAVASLFDGGLLDAPLDGLRLGDDGSCDFAVGCCGGSFGTAAHMLGSNLMFTGRLPTSKFSPQAACAERSASAAAAMSRSNFRYALHVASLLPFSRTT